MQLFPTLRRAALAVTAATVLTATGLGYWQAHGLLGGITVSHALGLDANPGDGTNILLIGLDSRKDQDGNDLPDAVLEKLHAGDSSVGGYNTNTLILLHIGVDGRVIAFSIPRDDYVAVTGIEGHDHIKIKEAYGLTKAQTEDQLSGEGVTDAAELEQRGREAGRSATLRAVRDLTGQPIDYFAEVNLAGFYDLAESLGGVEVCLNHAVHDDYSGADFPAGRQTLDGAQSLAFVRQRHGLKNGDLDRTHRQQAFLASVMRSLQDAGTFSDLDKFRSLMAVAHKDIVLSQGWDEQQLRRVAALVGGGVQFQTLPVVRYDNVDGQDVNIIDPAAIRAAITAGIDGTAVPTSTPPPAPSPSAQGITVVNAGDTSGLAAQTAAVLAGKGYTVEQTRDREDVEPTDTVVQYGTGADDTAQKIAELLGISTATAESTVPAGQIRVILGPDFALPSAGGIDTPLTEDAGQAGSGAQAASGTTTPAPDAGPAINGDGIVCVD
jgi:LCP family protein required for cell wall assembly